ncbi:MAG: type II/IV secretion system protein [Opitutae bacterium]|nr:type II/IV secretion system protein [Opitutae bacterium]
MTPFAQFIEALRKIAPEQRRVLDQAAEQHAGDAFGVMKLVVERAIVSQARACQLWADCLGVAHVNPFNVELPVGDGAQLPPDVARRARAVVLNSLPTAATVAMVEPTDEKMVASLAKVLGREISPVFAHPEEIEAILRLHFGEADDLASSLERVCESLPTLEGGREIRDARDVAELVHGEAFAELFNSILLTAFRRRASDIHLESAVDQCRVRMRIDGDMMPVLQLPRVVHDALIVRVKVLCQLDVAQRRLPQDGAFEINFGGNRPAFRASTLPGLYGEKAVLRLLGSGSEQTLPRLGALGLSDSTRLALRRTILRPNGILFVCGPTGSGKTTTLYSCLSEINRPDLNIVTIEDPVEYRLPGAAQHQVNAQIGLRFSEILRSVLRQDPDVILVGEIRDRETATIAAEAALTGHLVLSSLHTNDSLQAITRLIELGVEPHLVAPTVVGVLSQRLVRRICPSCKESYTAAPDDLSPFFTKPDAAPVTLYRGRGCSHCHGTGFYGRVGVHEMLEVSEGLRDLILMRATPAQMKVEAENVGFRAMRYDGLKKALLGWTTLEEVERNTLPELSYTAAE